MARRKIAIDKGEDVWKLCVTSSRGYETGKKYIRTIYIQMQ